MQPPEAATGQCEPQAAYEIGGQRWHKDQPGFAEAMAQAYEQHLRPRCLCQPDAEGQGIEMYVARLLEGYIVKRMPNTGSRHATHCPSYEPPADLSGLGPLLGTAIVENPITGQTTLRLDFPMSKMPGRSTLPAQSTASTSTSAATQGNKLTLRGLLHYLWDQAELTHWQPGFAGRRTWSTVRRHLLRAAENKLARGQPLLASLYIPEVFSVEQRDAINTRRLQLWSHALAAQGQSQRLLLMIAEVKEIVPARFGHKAVIKHVPDQAFVLDEPLFRRLGRCFERELALWGAEDDLQMILITTFRVDGNGTPGLVEMSLMLTTAQWLPIENGGEMHLVATLVRTGRRFIKGLRYNATLNEALVSASLVDCGTEPRPLFMANEQADSGNLPTEILHMASSGGSPIWLWRVTDGSMPPLPAPQPGGASIQVP